ncbi:hypothetical protein E2562_023537 [Oryza meyeriana var. granulata]|uniref:Uncharacterized protein n=1 Tax=Oryza meyeriana var. granulata TaxID=110450 RepID=A0A6G1DZS6_9ORYZ|nr:hypothetical protein E2562_023537 [Oryza meyeriana var. granulata]
MAGKPVHGKVGAAAGEPSRTRACPSCGYEQSSPGEEGGERPRWFLAWRHAVILTELSHPLKRDPAWLLPLLIILLDLQI